MAHGYGRHVPIRDCQVPRTGHSPVKASHTHCRQLGSIEGLSVAGCDAKQLLVAQATGSGPDARNLQLLILLLREAVVPPDPASIFWHGRPCLLAADLGSGSCQACDWL